MKTKLLITLLTTSMSAIFAQIELRQQGGAGLVNGDTITVTQNLVNDITQDVKVDIDAKSLYSSTKTIRVKKIEKTTSAPGSFNAICWGVCTIEEIWGSSTILVSDPQGMSSGQTVVFNGHLYPKIIGGNSTFRYVFFDQANPTDSTWVDVIFNIQNPNSLSVNESKIETSLKVFPNPATTELTIKLNSKEENKRIEMMDLLGKKIYSKMVKNEDSITQIDTSNLKAGIYLVSITSNKKAVRTEKVIITK
jgi:hypothetical protein